MERIGDILSQSGVVRVGARRVAADDTAITADKEFLEIPADIAGEAIVRVGEPGKDTTARPIGGSRPQGRPAG